MTITTLSMHSMVTMPGGGLSTSGTIYVGDRSFLGDPVVCSAVRFALPPDVGIVHSATLAITASAYTSYSNSQLKTKWGVLAASSQVLPTTEPALIAAPITSAGRLIGYDAPGMDHTLTLSDVGYNVDLTAAVQEAMSAGHLVDGDYIVILGKDHGSDDDAWMMAHGIGSPGAMELTLNYSEFSPPPDPEEQPIENAQSRSQGDDPVATYNTTAALTDGQTRSVGGPVAATVTLTAPVPQPGQTPSAGDNPQAIAGLSAVIADAMTQSVADTPEATSAGGWLDRPLFPTGLFPQGLFQ